jgi:peptide/nickel transport system permease protein
MTTGIHLSPAPDAPTGAASADTSAPSRRRGTYLRHRVLRSPSLLIAWLFVLLVVAWAFLPGLFTSQSPYEGNDDLSFASPSWGHPFGTDRLGRDIFARAVYGTGTTLSATIIAVLVAFTVGTLIGLIAGSFGGWINTALMRVVDVFLAIPGLLLAMVLVAVLGYSTRNIAVAVGISAIASFARVMRSEVIKVVDADFVTVAPSLGVSRWWTILTHIVPNSLYSVLSLASLEFGTSVLAVASLGFLGYGAPPPEPEWGILVSEGRDFIGVYPWIAILPGLLIAAFVLSTHRISTSFDQHDSNGS